MDQYDIQRCPDCDRISYCNECNCANNKLNQLKSNPLNCYNCGTKLPQGQMLVLCSLCLEEDRWERQLEDIERRQANGR